MSGDLDLWLLVLACGAATYLWRGLGVFVSGRIGTEGPVFRWLACVAYATLAALIARIVLLPVGTLEDSALWQRLLATAIALGIFFLARRNLFLGVVAGGASLVALVLTTGG